MAAAFACICGGVGVLALIRRHHLIVFLLFRTYGCAMNIVQCDSRLLPIHQNAEVSIWALPSTDRQQFTISSAVNLPAITSYLPTASLIKYVANTRFDASLMPLAMIFGMKPSISAAASERWRSSTVTKPSPGWNYSSQSIIGNRRILARRLLRCMSAIVYTPVTVFEALGHRAVYSKSQITIYVAHPILSC